MVIDVTHCAIESPADCPISMPITTVGNDGPRFHALRCDGCVIVNDGVGWPDRDRDGVVGIEDACPYAAGPAENKGCPDRDGDGIPDDKDVCPDDPEDVDGIEDANGCPEDDADNDGILDPIDKCPLKAEIMNGFEDEDGCPDEQPRSLRTASPSS